jgi:hypothetical protein
MQPAAFWAMHAAIATGGGLIVMLFGRRLSQTLRPGLPVTGTYVAEAPVG